MAGWGISGSLADFLRNAASHGASAVALSPVHAQFSATTDRFSPYSPSSRTLLNVLHAELDPPGAEAARLAALDLVNWPAATALRQAALDARFTGAEQGGSEWTAFQAFRTEGGAALEGHARFEALHAAITRDGGPWHWRQWPNGLADASGPTVRQFAEVNAREVTRHAFYQFVADRSLAAAQAAGRQAGMAIGLVSDLAVGVDSGGSQCWARPDQVLLGLNVGAPPDLLNTHGQSWGLSAFSPRGLQLHGFGVFIDMLRAAMRQCRRRADRPCHGARAVMGAAGRRQPRGRRLPALSRGRHAAPDPAGVLTPQGDRVGGRPRHPAAWISATASAMPG